MYASRHYLLGLAAFAFMAFGFMVSQVAMDGQLSQLSAVTSSGVFSQPCVTPPQKVKSQIPETVEDIRFIEFQLSDSPSDVREEIENFR
jgi:hypothetical protein